jgi:hypothetical protein
VRRALVRQAPVPLTTVRLTTVPLTTVRLTTVPLTTVRLTTVRLTTVRLTTGPRNNPVLLVVSPTTGWQARFALAADLT